MVQVTPLWLPSVELALTRGATTAPTSPALQLEDW